MVREGKIIDIHRREVYPGRVYIDNGYIGAVEETESAPDIFILPGLIDAHIHIESSMTTPGSFAAGAVSRGTTGVVSDPHEIANVLGMDGVRYMIEDGKKVPLKFWFGAPSCVPATSFESTGAIVSAADVAQLLEMEEVKYLSEMMNYPGVIFGDPEVKAKLSAARALSLPVDGHAPGLSGEELRSYVMAGITTDHECSNIKEAREKISLGMKILIREGSAARNLDALKDLLRTDPGMVMLCSDDLHPEMLLKGHINTIVARLINEGFDLFDVIRSCTVNPANHYGLDAGLLQPGTPADFIVVEDYRTMNIIETWIDGRKVFDRPGILFSYEGNAHLNKFNSTPIGTTQIAARGEGNNMRVIEAYDGELITGEAIVNNFDGSHAQPDTANDILKIVVKERYNDKPPTVAFIRGFGLKAGAFASSVAHDSHNIICVGTNDEDIVRSINAVTRLKGGLAVSSGDRTDYLQLPVGGIMSDRPLGEVAADYEALSDLVKSLGCTMSAPFMTLSFMALLVIPELKLSDTGLFDGREFKHVSLFI